MKRFVSVRNCVTMNATRPGIAESGMIKLIDEAVTIAKEGR